jgi:hypothetical protein
MDLLYLLPLFVIIGVVVVYCGWETYKLIKHDLNFDGLTVSYEDLFEDIPGDEDHVLMNIPPEVCKAANLKPGDTVSIEQGGNGLVIKKVVK